MINGFGCSPSRLRLLMLLFFLALAIPTLILIRQAYTQLQWEAFHRQRVLAETMAGRIDGYLTDIINTEEARSFTDYSFLVVEGNSAANYLRRSPLSNYPWSVDIPGLLGYFQIDAQDAFSTPLLPNQKLPGQNTQAALYGISSGEFDNRQALQVRILNILSRNRLVSSENLEEPPMEEVAITTLSATPSAVIAADGRTTKNKSPSGFDLLNTNTTKGRQKKAATLGENDSLGRVEDLELDLAYEKQNRMQQPKSNFLKERRQAVVKPEQRSRRKEQSLLAESYSQSSENENTGKDKQSSVKIALFESEIAPFEFSLLDSDHFVLYRKVWREGQRYIQGILIEQSSFIEQLVGDGFRDTALSEAANLAVAYEGNVLSGFGGTVSKQRLSSAEDLRGALLLRTDLSPPFQTLALVYSVSRLPVGPGGWIVGWVAVVLAVVLCGGIYLFYRLVLKQMALAEQQQNFVSAVSHELKTPLTSIRMYGEMLKQGWADEKKKNDYYDFIYSESERLSRLIENVLQLARMTRNDMRVSLVSLSVSELLSSIRAKIFSQIDRAGFTLAIDNNVGENVSVNIDTDLFAQIVINLVDNAIKFSAKSTQKKISLEVHLLSSAEVVFTLRDYGPGISKNQMRRIFQLFYRSEDELTRETTGTGIGLALVQQLAQLMDAKVDVINCEPGAAFKVIFPAICR